MYAPLAVPTAETAVGTVVDAAGVGAGVDELVAFVPLVLPLPAVAVPPLPAVVVTVEVVIVVIVTVSVTVVVMVVVGKVTSRTWTIRTPLPLESEAVNVLKDASPELHETKLASLELPM